MARDLVKEYRQGDAVRRAGERARWSDRRNAGRALDGVSLAVAPGAFVAVMGPSGSGKSTLLHLLGGLDTPTSGEVVVEGRPLSQLSDRELTLVRRRRIGFVFQFFNLVPVLNVEENIALPATIAGRRPDQYRERVDAVVRLVGLDGQRRQIPAQLSGGEQQRVAIARALFIEPAVLLADEPTGALDTGTGTQILELLRRVRDERGATILMVTNDDAVAGQADRVLQIRDGVLRTSPALQPQP